MFMAKNKLDRKSMNASQGVEALHQLASSYFIDRDGTMRKLHEIQISTNAIKVSPLPRHILITGIIKVSAPQPPNPNHQRHLCNPNINPKLLFAQEGRPVVWQSMGYRFDPYPDTYPNPNHQHH